VFHYLLRIYTENLLWLASYSGKEWAIYFFSLSFSFWQVGNWKFNIVELHTTLSTCIFWGELRTLLGVRKSFSGRVICAARTPHECERVYFPVVVNDTQVMNGCTFDRVNNISAVAHFHVDEKWNDKYMQPYEITITIHNYIYAHAVSPALFWTYLKPWWTQD
jgi:hypothetical protein